MELSLNILILTTMVLPSYQYEIENGLEYGRTYIVEEQGTPAGYEQADPFYITIGVDNSTEKNACVTKAKGDENLKYDATTGYTLTNMRQTANYKIQYHYQQLDGKYVTETESAPISAKVGDDISALTFVQDNDANPDPEKHLNGTTTSVLCNSNENENC